MNLNDFSKWLQNLRGSEYFPYPLYLSFNLRLGFSNVVMCF